MKDQINYISDPLFFYSKIVGVKMVKKESKKPNGFEQREKIGNEYY